MAQAAERLVQENLDDEALGVSSLMLKDPAAKRMIARAEKLGVAGKYIEFTKEIVKAAQAVSDEPLDLDMLGATGAVMLDLGFSPEATWAILAVTRSFAVGAHYIEEIERDGYRRTGQTLTPKEFYDGPADRPGPAAERPQPDDPIRHLPHARRMGPGQGRKKESHRQRVFHCGRNRRSQQEERD